MRRASSISTRRPADNLNALAKAKGVPVAEITACILDRPRHAELIAAVRKAGAAVQLIPDGDIAGVIWTTDPGRDRHRHLSGLGRRARRRAGGGGAALHRRPDPGPAACRPTTKSARAPQKMGITDINRKFKLEDMASADVIFSATGVTDGSLLGRRALPRRFRGDGTVVMRSQDRHRAPHQDDVPRHRRALHRLSRDRATR